jgi:hypothetical protein
VACLRVGTEKTWSSSSSDKPFVSGTVALINVSKSKVVQV